MSDPGTEAKRRAAEAARERLLTSAQALQTRLKPDVLAERALDRLRDRSEQAADGAVEAIRRRPVAAAAAATGVVGLIAAGPIMRLVRWMRDED